ncbi:type II toxin-antitoxin system VapC family toxin [Cellulomonas sp. PhB143]|uniref:type II toxin-antitoxin system VapC family toxin n=1 Tax=Cellulomonas sp. PhB143 TaxID=2485186 RepID=UPI000FA0D117|nr:type II toxin-antitoxin system VapC family toxin [Cellulomonas sp. PhB143]ROS75277.1 hypothetical protein EDF32_1685 [Cellulomonas sp. PhB143]
MTRPEPPRRLFVDTAVLAYALGGEHAMRGPCRALLEAAARGDVELHASVEMVQELLHHRLRRGDRAAAVAQARGAAAACVLHPFDADVLARAVDLVEQAGLGGRDAVHAATALQHGFAALVSPDRDFDAVPGVERLDPGRLTL